MNNPLNQNTNNNDDDITLKELVVGISIIIVALVAIVSGIVFGWQSIRIYIAESTGKAELARADSNRQILVREAQAKKEAAIYNKEASIIDAQAVKEANDIIQEGLGGPEGYLRFLYIQALSQDGKTPSVIYIPTEAGMPILEAGKR